MPTNPEQMLISAVLNTQDHVTSAARGITRKFFSSYEDEWKFIERHISRYKRTPSSRAFQAKFPQFRLKKDDDVAYWCDEVRQSFAQSQLTSSLQDVIAKIDDGDLEKALKAMHRSAMDIESNLSGESADGDIFENWQDTFDEVMRRHRRQREFGQSGLPTGFPTLDERTGGPQPGHVWVVAARLGQGKTWSLVRMAVAAAFSGFTVQYDALEGSRPEIAMRVHTFASSEYGKEVFKNLDLSQGRNFSPRSYKEFLQSIRNEVAGKFHIADTSRGPVSPLTIAAQIERNKPDAVYLDYITLMDGDSAREDWSGQNISKLSKQLHQVSGAYMVPIIAAAQLNRNAAGRRELSGPEDLAESDAIGRDADAVITMRQLSKRVIAFKLAKFRHGRDGYTWYCKFLPNTGQFEEVTFDEAQDLIAEDKDEDEDTDNFTFKPRQKGSFKKIQESRKKKIIVPSKKIAVTKKKIVVPRKGVK